MTDSQHFDIVVIGGGSGLTAAYFAGVKVDEHGAIVVDDHLRTDSCRYLCLWRREMTAIES